MIPQSAFKPFLREDGSFRFLTEAEFAGLSNAQKAEYLERVSRQLQKSIDQLRRMIDKRDVESSCADGPS